MGRGNFNERTRIPRGMPKLTEDAERAIRAFAYYHDIDQKSTEFWIKQWSLSAIPKSKPVNKYPEPINLKQ